MTWKAQIYIAVTIAAGAGLIGSCIASGRLGHSDAFLAYCLLAWFSSVMKVRLPGMTGTMSANFLFVLVSIAVFTLPETVVLAVMACVVQCIVRARRRPRPVQVAFNMAAWSLSTGAAYRISHWFAQDREGRLLLLLPVASALFFIANTFLVSGVLSLIEHRPLFRAWQQCYLWTFPYYLVGSGIAALVVETGRTEGWPLSLAILPLMYLLFLFYEACVKRISSTVPATLTVPPASSV